MAERWDWTLTRYNTLSTLATIMPKTRRQNSGEITHLKEELSLAIEAAKQATNEKEVMQQAFEEAQEEANQEIELLKDYLNKSNDRNEILNTSINKLQEDVQGEIASLRNLISRERHAAAEEIGRRDQEIMHLRQNNGPTYHSTPSDKKKETSREVPLPRQSEYDGKSSWQGFIAQFRALAMSCQWTDEEKQFRLMQSLKDEAATYVFEQLDNTARASFYSLEMALEQRFCDRQSIGSYLTQLENRKMLPKETLAEYTADIKRLVLKGYPTADMETRDTISLRYFLKGLGDQQMHLAVGMKEPKNLAEARLAAEMYITLKEETARSQARPLRNIKAEEAPPFVTTTQLNEIMASLDKRMGELLNMAQESSRNNRSNFHRGNHGNNHRGNNYRANPNIKCYNCEEIGHIARNCPKKVEQPADQTRSPSEN